MLVKRLRKAVDLVVVFDNCYLFEQYFLNFIYVVKIHITIYNYFYLFIYFLFNRRTYWSNRLYYK